MSVTITSLASTPAASKSIIDTNFSNVKTAVESLQTSSVQTALGVTYPPSSGWTSNTVTVPNTSDFSRGYGYFSALGCGTGTEYRGYWRTKPGSAFRITACLQSNFVNDVSHGAGIALKETSSGKVINWGPTFYNTGSTYLELAKYSAEQTFAANYYSSNNEVMKMLANASSPGAWLRMRDDGTTLFFLYSMDGITWTERYRVARNNYFTTGPDLVGVRYFCGEAANIIPAFRLLHWVEESLVFTALSRSGWTASASSYYDPTTYAASKALDGNSGTIYHSANAGTPGTFDIDMQSAQTFNAIRIVTRQDSRTDLVGYEIYVSDDGSTWGSYVKQGVMTNGGPEDQYIYLDSSYSKRYVRIKALSAGNGTSPNSAFAFNEVYVGSVA